MTTDFNKLRYACIFNHIRCTRELPSRFDCAEDSCPLRIVDVSVVMANDVTRNAVPINEFTEHCTGDMKSMDTAHHYMLNPQKSDFPDAAARQKEWWERNDTALLKAQAEIRRLQEQIKKLTDYIAYKHHSETK